MIRLSRIAAIAILCGAATSTSARADYAYAYSHMEIENFTVRLVDPDAAITIDAVRATGTTSAIVKDTPGGIDGDVDGSIPVDPRQAYVGPAGTAPAENFFGQKGLVDPDYARGDAVIYNNPIPSPFYVSDADQPVGPNAENVAEAFVSSPVSGEEGLDQGAADGQWSITYDFTLDAATQLEFTVDFINELIVEVLGLGTAEADFSFGATIFCRNLDCIIFEFAPDQLNLEISQINTGMSSGGTPDGASVTEVSDLIQAGEYTLTIAAQESVVVTVVPEPATFAMMGLGLTAIGGVALTRRRRSGAA